MLEIKYLKEAIEARRCDKKCITSSRLVYDKFTDTLHCMSIREQFFAEIERPEDFMDIPFYIDLDEESVRNFIEYYYDKPDEFEALP